MVHTFAVAIGRNFLGNAPRWYKLTIVGFLIVNPILMVFAGPFVAGWVIVAQFIFTLAMALQCYPLQPGGLIALEAIVIGMTTPDAVFKETEANLSVILLLMFMVAGIYFLRDLLLLIFTKVLIKVRSKLLLSITFTGVAAVLSAFLDALTVAAVIIAVATGFYTLYHRFASGPGPDDDHAHDNDDLIGDRREDLNGFRGFLRSLLMHALVGTALGGIATLIGEPQNLLIGQAVGWDFGEFLVRMAPISIPVLLVGLATTALLERTKWFGYGTELPSSVRDVMEQSERNQSANRSARSVAKLATQGFTALLLIAGLALHVAEVGLVGLAVIVIATAFNGIVNEKSIGHAFEEALPFTALLVTFFAIVAVITEQSLFTPVIDWALAQAGRQQLISLYAASGLLSAISDNVFVATVYIGEVAQAFAAGSIDREQFELLAISINAGTNLPSVATPNGQAAFLFLLTSAIAPLVRLGYLRMLWMALPYAVAMTATGLIAIVFLL